MKRASSYILKIMGVVLCLSTSCTKLLEIPDSKSQIESDIVFKDSVIATSALLGAYYTFSTVHVNVKFMSLYVDELTYPAATGINNEYALSRLSSDNPTNQSVWGILYSVIYQCNAILEGINKTLNISESSKKGIIAEAKFLRGTANFYLVSFYDNIPLIPSTNVSENKSVIQASRDQVYAEIIKDLNEAKNNLSTNYQGIGKVRANKFACMALLARVYLYLERWSEAQVEASEIINSGNYSLLSKLDDVFLANSNEAIFQLWMNNGFLTDAAQLIPVSGSVIPNYPFSSDFVRSFESSDLRQKSWIGTNNILVNGITSPYSYPSKYKNRTASSTRSESIMVLRLSEQYLIRAEAFSQLGNLSAATSDLNMIRKRAGVTEIGISQSLDDCLQFIAIERRHELFGEWAHRFLDLKRTKKLDGIIGMLKSSWKPSAKAFPIPMNELTYNNKLNQNDGY